MNRATILLNVRPADARCAEIADYISAEHFGSDADHWELLADIPADTPLHLRDQFEAEIKGRNIADAYFLVVYGPETDADSE